jgi:8-oxo-dGTP pyrophosphatase MutT (NUDIX family)
MNALRECSTKVLQALTRLLFPFVRVYWRVIQPKSFGARALVFHGDRVLLIKTAYGTHWQTPGGTMNARETPEQCVLRELREETGLDGVVREKLGLYTSSAEGKHDTIHLFIIDAQQDNLVIEWELKTARWFTLDSLPEDISPATKRRIQEYQSGERGVTKAW